MTVASLYLEQVSQCYCTSQTRETPRPSMGGKQQPSGMTAIPCLGFWENQASIRELGQEVGMLWFRRRECHGSGGGNALARKAGRGRAPRAEPMCTEPWRRAREPPGPERCAARRRRCPVPTCARGDGGGAEHPGDRGHPGHPDVPQGGGSGGGAPRVLPQVPRDGGRRHW